MYTKIAEHIFDCHSCPTPCDGKSKMNYQFQNDVKFAEEQEDFIIAKINKNQKYLARKSKEIGFPDIEITEINGQLSHYLEVKAQRRTFMAVEKIVPQSDLKPSETVAINLSDLLRYIEIEAETKIPTTIVWVVSDRPCLVTENEVVLYSQKIDVLKTIYKAEGNKRRFRRKSGSGDIVNGTHKGVVVNYHFSLNELEKWNFTTK